MEGRRRRYVDGRQSRDKKRDKKDGERRVDRWPLSVGVGDGGREASVDEREGGRGSKQHASWR